MKLAVECLKPVLKDGDSPSTKLHISYKKVWKGSERIRRIEVYNKVHNKYIDC